MAKSHNQKAKILYLAQMLRGTGENRVLSMQEILTVLMEYGIQAERKSIYDDIEALRDFGMDVKFKRGRPGGYYLTGQMAEEPVTAADEQEEIQVTELSAQKESGKNWKCEKGEVSGGKPMKLLCSSRLESEVRAYFGKEAEYRDKGLGYFTVITGQLNDAQFFGWLTAMGKDVHIVKPKKAAQAYRDYLKSLAKEYK